VDVLEQTQSQEEGRGVLILILGILSITALGPILGIPAWIMGRKDLRKIREGRIPSSERSLTQTGTILGIISSLLGLGLILLWIVAVVFLIAVSPQ